MAGVRLDHVSKQYPDGTIAVDDISLDVADEEFVVLVGPSGCGKSTTLRLIAGLESATSGDVYVGSKRVNQLPAAARDIAMVFQNYALYPHMTVYKNLSFGLRQQNRWGVFHRGLVSQRRRSIGGQSTGETTRQRVQCVARQLGIEHLLKKRPHQLSGGERQRVALGRAIVRNPAAFLFDEPLSNLDAKLRGELRSQLKSLHRELQATMVYVTHDQIEAMTLGDRIAVMNRGRIQQLDRPIDVYRQPANRFVAGFIGSIPMNLVDGVLVQNKGETWFRGGTLTINVTERVQRTGLPEDRLGRQVTLGVRGEEIKLHATPASADSLAGAVSWGRVSNVDPLGDSQIVNVSVHARGLPTGGDSPGPPRGQLAYQATGPKGGQDAPSTELTVRTAGNSSNGRDAEVQIDWSASRFHWFDGQSGERLKLEG